MPVHPSYHAAEARFLKLAMVEGLLTPARLKQAEEVLVRRHAAGEYSLSIEQVLLDERMLTEEQCERIWELVAESEAEAPAEEEGDPPPRRLGGYQILETIGRGGMGTVYKARQMTMDRVVAIKILKPELARDIRYIRRFFREARAAGALNHGNIVRVYDVGEASGRYYFSMEYVEGKSLKVLMKEEGRLSVDLALDVMEQICRALSAAHRQGIIHRDIKPDNILLKPDGRAKLADLGLAKRIAQTGPRDSSDTKEGLAIGTPHYMSPEQWRNASAVDSRSDLYSLGATIFHAVTGEVPFDGEAPIEIMMKVTREDPPRADWADPLLPEPFCDLLFRVMARDPGDRPASAEELLDEIECCRKAMSAGRAEARQGGGAKPTEVPAAGSRFGLRTIVVSIAAASTVFLACCATWRLASAEADAAPVTPSFFAAHQPGGAAHSSNPPAGDGGMEIAPRPETQYVSAPSADPSQPRFRQQPPPQPKASAPSADAIREFWKERPTALAKAMKMVNVALRERSDREETAELHRIRSELEARYAAAAERELKARSAVAEALCRDGFLRAAEAEIWEMREDYPECPAADAIREKVLAVRALAELYRRQYVEKAAAHLAAGDIGHAAAMTEWLAARAESDGADPDGEFKRALAELTARLNEARQARARRDAERRAAAARLAADMAELREKWNRRDAEAVVEEVARTAARTADAGALAALNLEAARAKLLVRLHRRVVDGINMSGGAIRDEIFLNKPIGGTVESATAKILVLSGTSGSITASMLWEKLSHPEYRRLAMHVLGRFSGEDPAALAGLSFAEGKAEEATAALRSISMPDSDVRAVLGAENALLAVKSSRAAADLREEAEALLGEGRIEDAMRKLEDAGRAIVAAGIPDGPMAEHIRVLALADEAFERCAPFARGTAPLPGMRVRWRLDAASPWTTSDWLAGVSAYANPGDIAGGLRDGLTFAMPLQGNIDADIFVDCSDEGDRPVELELAMLGDGAGEAGTVASAVLSVSNRNGGPWGWRIGDEESPVGTGAKLRAGGVRKISARRIGRRLEWAIDGDIQEVRVLPVSFPQRCRVRLRAAHGSEESLRRFEMAGRPAEDQMKEALARLGSEAEKKLREAMALPERERPGALDDLAMRYRGCAGPAARAAAECAFQLFREGRDRRPLALAAASRAVGLHRQPTEVVVRLREELAAIGIGKAEGTERIGGR